ncbi:DUF1311 domain-containing protein [Pseudomaricurvus sp. HS19]|nr:DUF1311 domain-containing protein [Pseudomaricurvus sp. HS19]
MEAVTDPAPIVESQPAPALCTDDWYRAVESTIMSGDGQGHGPDIGSDEWKSVVEFRLGVRGQPQVPARDDPAWCDYIEGQLQARKGEAAAVPTYACDAELPAIPTLICSTPELAVLDQQMAAVYGEALAKQPPPLFKAEQRGWIKGRDECWKATDHQACVKYEYQHRIAELQARFRLVEGRGPVVFACEGDPRNEVVITFYPTEPRTLVAERGDSVSLMFADSAASGSKYLGPNESFWEHQGEAKIVWGYNTEPMTCRPVS